MQTSPFRLISVLNLPRIPSLLVLVSALTAQVADNHTRIGLPQDWTHQHVVFNRQLLLQHPELAAVEPRVLHQFLHQMAYSPVAASSPSDEASSSTPAMKRDWSVNLGGGKVAFGMSPVKYGFDVNAPPAVPTTSSRSV